MKHWVIISAVLETADRRRRRRQTDICISRGRMARRHRPNKGRLIFLKNIPVFWPLSPPPPPHTHTLRDCSSLSTKIVQHPTVCSGTSVWITTVLSIILVTDQVLVSALTPWVPKCQHTFQPAWYHLIDYFLYPFPWCLTVSIETPSGQYAPPSKNNLLILFIFFSSNFEYSIMIADSWRKSKYIHISI